MPSTGIFYRLVEDARRAWPAVRKAVAQGIGADRTFQALREQGFAVTRQVIRELAAAERAMQAQMSDLRFLNRSQRPDPLRLPIALTKMRQRFAFVVRLRGINTQTGEAETRHVTVSTPVLLTRAEMEKQAREALRRNPERYPLEVTDTVIVEGFQEGPAGTLI